MRVECIKEIPDWLCDVQPGTYIPKVGDICTVVSDMKRWGHTYYTLQESTSDTYYDSIYFRRVTDISDLQKLTVIKTKVKELEDA